MRQYKAIQYNTRYGNMRQDMAIWDKTILGKTCEYNIRQEKTTHHNIIQCNIRQY